MVRLGGGGARRRGVTGSDRAQVVVAGTEQHALPLRTLEHAVIVRNQILRWFGRAAQEPDAARRRGALTFTIVGGGPTGVEFAGALAELIRGSFRKDYASLDFREVRLQADVQQVTQDAVHLRDGTTVLTATLV